jgi:hypothetical protein
MSKGPINKKVVTNLPVKVDPHKRVKKGDIDPVLHALLRLATPMGSEKVIVGIINAVCAKLSIETTLDEKGNLRAVVGEGSKTIFSSHMDTVHDAFGALRLYQYTGDKKKGIIFAKQNNKKCVLGADDKVGVWLMLKLMEAGTPGLYIFHMGEEQGRVGSKYIAASTPEILEGYERAIAFDRAGYLDIVDTQISGECCSDTFVEALSTQLDAGLDDKYPDRATTSGFTGATGSYTDTASYMKLIPECTNISVGYDNQHTSEEIFDWPWLNETLLPILLKVKWEDLPTVRDHTAVPVYTNSYRSGGYGNYGGYSGYGMGADPWYEDDDFWKGNSQNDTIRNVSLYEKDIPRTYDSTATWVLGEDLPTNIYMATRIIEKWTYKKGDILVDEVKTANKTIEELKDLVNTAYYLFSNIESLKILEDGDDRAKMVQGDIDDWYQDMYTTGVYAGELVDDDSEEPAEEKDEPGRPPGPADNMTFDSNLFKLTQANEEATGGYNEITIVNSAGVKYSHSALKEKRKGDTLYYNMSGYRLPYMFYTIKGDENFLKG